MHVLGRLTRYKYSDYGQLIKETGYNNEDHKLVFKFEYGYNHLP
ncbi:hypothetical protein [Winogradskyella wichelsiae]|nr:hypothetical protein [Winogradskyella wichelsiae]